VTSALTRSERFDRRYRSLRIWWPTSLRLRWIARTDRRAGLPLGLGPETTPLLHELVARHDDVCEHERTSCLAYVEALEIRLSEIQTELRSLQTMLDVRTEAAERAAVPPTEAQLGMRFAGEEHLSTSVTRHRRVQTHQRAADAASAARLDAQRALDATLGEQAQLRARCELRWDIARSRVLRYGQHTRRQATIYRRALVRRHPQREQLIRTWRTDLCTTPTWAAADQSKRALLTTGVAA
jgi:hypothetical protein